MPSQSGMPLVSFAIVSLQSGHHVLMSRMTTNAMSRRHLLTLIGKNLDQTRWRTQRNTNSSSRRGHGRPRRGL
jgi:hypothetical protein